MSVKGPDKDERISAKAEEALAAEAQEWLAREAHADPEEGEKFEQWLAQSPKHVEALLRVSGWKSTLPADLAHLRIDADQLLSESTNVIHVPGTALPAARSRRSRFRWPRAALIAFGAAAAAAIVLVAVPPLRDIWSPNVYATSVGEQRTVALPDGSIIAMNTQSRIRVSYSDQERAIYLSTGQALFTVAHDKDRPFRVHVDGGGVVEAIGTKFDVRRLADRTSVAVLEGRVQVTPAEGKRSTEDGMHAIAERTRLAAGEAVSILDRGGVTPPAPVDVAEVDAWRERRLVFRDDTLRDIIDEFHRYGRTQIRIEGDELAERRYSGVWDADRPEILLTYLGSYGGVRVDREGEGFVIRPPIASPAPE